MEELVEFQENNCANGCKFADKKALETNDPACTKCGRIEYADDGKTCISRRED